MTNLSLPCCWRLSYRLGAVGELARDAWVVRRAFARAAMAGDDFAKEIFAVSARYLGRGCAVLIDLLNPDAIVIGSIYARCRELLEPIAREEISREALAASRSICRIVPAELGDRIGDMACLCAAMEAVNE